MGLSRLPLSVSLPGHRQVESWRQMQVRKQSPALPAFVVSSRSSAFSEAGGGRLALNTRDLQGKDTQDLQAWTVQGTQYSYHKSRSVYF